MSTSKTLKASGLTADSRKGRQATDLFRDAYNAVALDEDCGQYFNENPAVAPALRELIRQFSQKGPVFPVFLEIEVGGKSKDELVAEIEANGMFASEYSRNIMGKDAWKPGNKETVRFGKSSVRDLGFTKPPTTRELWKRIEELGHALCEPGDGPALRREWKDQPKGTVCWTAMKQITASFGYPDVFLLHRFDDGKTWLNAS